MTAQAPDQSRQQDLAQALLDAARKAGADAADALVLRNESLSIETREGALEHAERAEAEEYGLRVLVGQRQAVIGASDADPLIIAELATRAVAMAKAAPDDPHIGLADPAQLAQDTDSSTLDMWDDIAPDPEDLTARALAAEEAANRQPGVTQVQSSGAHWSATQMWLAASNGFCAGTARSDWSVGCVAIAGSGAEMERDYAAKSRAHRADLPDACEIGALAGQRAAERCNPRRARSGRFAVLYDERVAASLIGHLTAAINGTAIANGASWARDLLDAQILPRGVTLTEEPHRPRIAGSRLFDAEGLPTAPRAVVADGMLTGWTLDLATGRKLGLPSTANARRGTGGPPAPGLGNLTLSGPTQSRTELLTQMGSGLLVTSMIGSTINPTTGDYSRGASGFWIENGEIAYPVNECTIAGNLRDMLPILQLGDDARPERARIVPSLLIGGMTIASGT